MKKLAVFFMLAFLSFSCSSSDEAVNVTEAKLIGKWYFKTTKVMGETFPYDDHEPCGKDFLEFREDGFVVNGDVWDCELYEEVTGVWVIDGNKVIISDAGESESATVTKLNSSTLIVNLRTDYFDDGELVDVVLTFTRS